MTFCDSVQELLQGNTTLLGNGHVRDVYLADYMSKTLVIKTLREVSDEKRQHIRAKMHRVEAAALDAVCVVDIYGIFPPRAYM